MSVFLLAAIGTAYSAATPAGDPVSACREQYPDDHPGYVRCLEQALLEHRQPPASTGGGGTAAPTGLGAEQVREPRGEEDEEVTVRIVAVTYDARGLGTFRTADGQVWKETTAAPANRRLDAEKEYGARIVRSWLGGYRMHVDGVRWMKTVRRIE